MNVNHAINLLLKHVYRIVQNEKFCVVQKPVEHQHINADKCVINYFHAVIIDVRKHVMMDHVPNVYYYLRIVKHVHVEKLQWIMHIEHHVLIL